MHWSFPHISVLIRSKILTPRSRASEILTTQNLSAATTAICLRICGAVIAGKPGMAKAQRWCVHRPWRCERINDHVCSPIKTLKPTSEWKWGIIDMICRATPRLRGKLRARRTQQSKGKQGKKNNFKKSTLQAPTPLINLRKILLRCFCHGGDRKSNQRCAGFRAVADKN